MIDKLSSLLRSASGALAKLSLPLRITALAVVLVLVVGAGGIWYLNRGLPEGVALQVADHAVTVAEIDQRTSVLEGLYGIREPADPAGADNFRRAAAQTVAVSEVVDRVARERGISVGDDVVQKQLDELAAAREKAEGTGGFVRLLGRIGVSEQDVREELRRRETHSKLFEEVRAGAPKVSDGDVRAAYDQRKATLVQPERRTISNIVLAGKDEAEMVLGEARTGTDFPALARQHSLDRATKDAGGVLGPVAQDQLEGEYGEAAFAGPAGPFGPVQTSHGWNVGLVSTVTPARQLGFDESKDRLRKDLERERVLAAWSTWLDERIAEQGVEYADNFRPADPASAPPMGDAAPPAAPEPPR